MSKKPVTMWCSKYALTGGITEHKGQADEEFFWPEGWSCTIWEIGKDAHATREEAVAVAEKKRVRKIQSVEKQLARLRNMTF